MVAEVVIERGCIQATLTWEIVSESLKKNIPMLLLHVMMTLKKLLFVNTAILSITDQDGNGLAVEDGHDFNATPTEVSKNDLNVTLTCVDDAHKVNLCQYSSFFNNLSRWRKSCSCG